MTAATATEQDSNVFTILRVPMTDAWGKYWRNGRTIWLSPDVPPERAPIVVRRLLTGQCPKQGEV